MFDQESTLCKLVPNGGQSGGHPTFSQTPCSTSILKAFSRRRWARSCHA